jgi:hypothetical protein
VPSKKHQPHPAEATCPQRSCRGLTPDMSAVAVSVVTFP